MKAADERHAEKSGSPQARGSRTHTMPDVGFVQASNALPRAPISNTTFAPATDGPVVF